MLTSVILVHSACFPLHFGVVHLLILAYYMHMAILVGLKSQPRGASHAFQ